MKAAFLIPFLAFSVTWMDPCSPKAKRSPLEAAPLGSKILNVTATTPHFVDVPVSYEGSGMTGPADIQRITSPASGIIATIYVGEGDRIEEGDPLFSLDPALLEKELEVKKTRSKEAAARLEALRRKLSLSTDVGTQPPTAEDVAFLDEESTPPTPVATSSATPPPDAQNNAEMAKILEAAVSRYDAEAKAIEELLQNTVMKSPLAGVVRERQLSEGNAVDRGETVLSIAVMDPLTVVFKVPEEAAAFSDKQSRISVLLPGEETTELPGRVVATDPDVDASTKTFSLRAHVDNPEGRLKGEQSVKVKLFSEKKQRVMVIPRRAVVREVAGNYFYVVYGNQARRQKVELGRDFAEDQVEVLGVELRADDWVLVEWPEALKNGDFVRVAEAQPIPAPVIPENPMPAKVLDETVSKSAEVTGNEPADDEIIEGD